MSDSLSRLSWLQIERACCRFEDAWQAGDTPGLAAEIERASPQLVSVLLYELIRIDREYRHLSDRSVSRDHYVSLFPDHAQVIEQAFRDDDDTDEGTTRDSGRPLSPGTRIQQWEIVESLGQGGYSDVYLVRDLKSKMPSALKLLREVSNDHGRRGRDFQLEAEMLRKLDHPGIVRVLDAGVTDSGIPWLQMDYVRGRSVRAMLDSGKQSLEDGIRILIEVALAVGHAHRNGLYHRDLKPENIIVQADGRPCIVDFGLALGIETRLLYRNEVAGTVAYMSPEQIQGQTGRIDGRTDVWALGIILYEFLTVRKPFQARRRSDVIVQILDVEPVPPSQITDRLFPPELDQVCLKALATQPADRFSTTDAFAAELQTALTSLTSTSAFDRSTPAGWRSPTASNANLATYAYLWRTVGLLPGTITWLRLWWQSSEPQQTADERQMLAEARRRHLKIIAAALVTVSLVILLAASLWNSRQSRQFRTILAELGRAEISDLDELIETHSDFLDQNAEAVENELINQKLDRTARRNLQIALLPRNVELTETVCESMLTAPDDTAGSIWQLLRSRLSTAHRERAAHCFERELLSETVTAPQLAALLPKLDQGGIDELEQAGGRVTPQFAFCQTLDWQSYDEICRHLAEANYFPVRCRPCFDGSGDRTLVAAVWNRGRVDFEVHPDLRTDALATLADTWQHDSRVPLDLVRHPAVRDSDKGTRFTAISVTAGRQASGFDVIQAATTAECRSALSVQAASGLVPISISAASMEGDSQESVLLAFRRVPGTTRAFVQQAELTPDYLTDLRGLYDLCVCPARPVSSVGKLLDEQEQLARGMLAVDSNDFAAGFVLGRSLAYQHENKEAIAILSDLITGRPAAQALKYRPYAWPLRAMCLARLGDSAGAAEDITQLKKFLVASRAPEKWRGALLGMLNGLRDIYLGQTDAGIASLEALVVTPDVDGRFYGTAGLSAAAGFLRDSNPSQAGRCLMTAESELRKLIREKLISSSRVYQTTELATVREQPEFAGWLRQTLAPVEYAAIWHSTDAFVARESHGHAPDRHLRDCDAFIADGFTPSSISVAQPSPDQPLMTASVWHRSRWTSRNHAAQTRRVRAAAALISLQPDADWWKLLLPHDDPTFASRLLHRLRMFGVSLDSVTEVLRATSDSALQRLLLLVGGEYRDATVNKDASPEFIEVAKQLVESSEMAGVVNAARWSLKQFDVSDVSGQTPIAHSQKLQHGHRYVSPSEIEMVAVAPAAAFSVGSPESEEGRSPVEVRRRVEKSDRWMISTTEVTTHQFKRVGLRLQETDDEHPARATWYQAAEFCNRLSEQEGIDEAQWYYVPNADGTFGTGMTSRPVARQLKGYRLPTEVEWEFTCRAGADTAWSTGNDAEFLDRYAWFLKENQQLPAPAGLLCPNALGCFDMAGNLAEWCHEAWNPNPRNWIPRSDETILTETERVIRGGSFNLVARHCRSAARLPCVPNRRASYGFRVVRSWPNDAD